MFSTRRWAARGPHRTRFRDGAGGRPDAPQRQPDQLPVRMDGSGARETPIASESTPYRHIRGSQTAFPTIDSGFEDKTASEEAERRRTVTRG